MPKKTRLTKEKAEQAVQMLHEGIPAYKVAQSVGYAASTALHSPHVMLENETFLEAKSEFMQLLEARHPQLKEKLADQIAEGLEANRAISAIVTGGKEKEANGTTTDFIEVPDHATRHKYVTTTLELYGELADKKNAGGNNVFNIGVLVSLVRQAEKERGLKPI